MGILTTPKAIKAANMAREAHAGVFRKWTPSENPEPYFNHPERIANRVAVLPGATDDDVAAAYLHDVLEDTKFPSSLIAANCGEVVIDLVKELTNPTHTPEWEGRSRAEKRQADWEHLKTVSSRAKRIKLVDRIDNLGGFLRMPFNFLRKYIEETRQIHSICKAADPELASELLVLIESAAAHLAANPRPVNAGVAAVGRLVSAVEYYLSANSLGCECNKVVDCGQCAVCHIVAAIGEVKATTAAPLPAPTPKSTFPNSPAPPGVCPCRQCLGECGVDIWWMVVCQTCGNKRCPKANNHRNTCTNSNELGQPGAA